MPQLLAIAEYITKTRAICMVCGNPANHTQRLVGNRCPGAARRAGHLRGALPPLLRSHPGGRRGTEPAGRRPVRDGRRRRGAAMSDRATRSGARGQPARPGRVVPGRQPARGAGLWLLVAPAPRRRSRCGWPPKPPFYAMNLAIGVTMGSCCSSPCSSSRGRCRRRLRRADDVRLLRLPLPLSRRGSRGASTPTACGPTPASCPTPTSAG